MNERPCLFWWEEDQRGPFLQVGCCIRKKGALISENILLVLFIFFFFYAEICQWCCFCNISSLPGSFQEKFLLAGKFPCCQIFCWLVRKEGRTLGQKTFSLLQLATKGEMGGHYLPSLTAKSLCLKSLLKEGLVHVKTLIRYSCTPIDWSMFLKWSGVLLALVSLAKRGSFSSSKM